MYVNKDGWLVASPHRYVPIQGDNVVDTSDMIGDYKLINLGKDINRTAKQSVYVSLNADGSISGDLGGKFKPTSRIPIASPSSSTASQEPFEGVLQWQWNEAAGALTPIFTGGLFQRRVAVGFAHGPALAAGRGGGCRRRAHVARRRERQLADAAHRRRARHATSSGQRATKTSSTSTARSRGRTSVKATRSSCSPPTSSSTAKLPAAASR